MTETNKHIEDLIQRFLDGETSNDEERELYAFFSSESVPDDLLQYKPMFEYFETGLAQEPIEDEIVRIPKNKKALKEKLWIGISVAASALILIFAGSQFLSKHKSFDMYEGSYISNNGVKTYDRDLIEAEDKAIQASIEEQEREFNNLMRAPEEKVMAIQESMEIPKEYRRIKNNS